MKTILFITLFTAKILSAQTVIFLQGGMDSRTGILTLEEPSTMAESWEPATSVSMGLDFFLTKSLAISASMQYDIYPFDAFRSNGVSIPEIWLKSSSGSASKMYRISLEGKVFLPSHTGIFVYVVSGIDYTIERAGEIKLMYADLNGPDFERTILSHSRDFWMHTFGLGLRYFVSHNVGFDLMGRSYSNFSTRLHKSINIGLTYTL